MAETNLSGSCFCGAVRYRLTRPPMFVNCCHCRDCQKQTGGAFAINALIERSCIELDDGSQEPLRITMPTESGRPHDIYRCAKCQTALWSDYGRRGVMVFVRVSTLDQAHNIVPDAHIFTRSKAPWVVLPPGARSFDVYYDMKKEWPKESLARRAAILGAG
ncbi:GFA family protein [Dongia sp.]|uniref:GFA family protein n=1 Tax=Dongia sp. TaxID=1977262 RepID=UPI003752CC34